MGLQTELEQEVNRLKFIIENLYTAINASTVILFDKEINTVAECGGIDSQFIEKSVKNLMQEVEKALKVIGLEDESKILILESGKLGIYANPISDYFILMCIVQNNIEVETRKDAIYRASIGINKIAKNLLKYAKAYDI